MNNIMQALVLVLITIAIIFAVVLKSPVVALAGLLITIGTIVWCKESPVKGARYVR